MPASHLTTAEVAAMFRVHPDTVRRWGEDPQVALTPKRLPGGEFRWLLDEVRTLLGLPKMEDDIEA